MRLRACVGGLLLFAAGCAGTQKVRIEVDGRTIELRPSGGAAGDLAGRWSPSPDCGNGGGETIGNGTTARRLSPDSIEIVDAGGFDLRLYRCPR